MKGCQLDLKVKLLSWCRRVSEEKPPLRSLLKKDLSSEKDQEEARFMFEPTANDFRPNTNWFGRKIMCLDEKNREERIHGIKSSILLSWGTSRLRFCWLKYITDSVKLLEIKGFSGDLDVNPDSRIFYVLGAVKRLIYDIHIFFWQLYI